ncbi:histidine phosphatase family protein [Streptomyces sp. NBC_01261]|uniref:histidine phosphatase family protein n=1 Tax=Streptomyces sp. NBC_01261 TaxID=2903802 RepID=UPI002E2EB14E|nr:histidine phosphatase family protein [Streptomyces sp. NBC_01261]
MREFIVEADGGSRGNPGPAGYGSVVIDATTGETLAEAAEYIGIATNNVAEYRGLVAGLRTAHALDPAAHIHVRMDSKLVVEQMSGRWKIKHPDMKPLAAEAGGVYPATQVTYEWIPRAQNKHADRLANEAMDAGKRGEQWSPSDSTADLRSTGSAEAFEGRGSDQLSDAGPGETPKGHGHAQLSGAGSAEAFQGRGTHAGLSSAGSAEASQGRGSDQLSDAGPGETPKGHGHAQLSGAGSAEAFQGRGTHAGLSGAGSAEAFEGRGSDQLSDAGPGETPKGHGHAQLSSAGSAEAFQGRGTHAGLSSAGSAEAFEGRGSDQLSSAGPADALKGRGELRDQPPPAGTVTTTDKTTADTRAARNVATPSAGWAPADMGAPATFVLLRHGETPLTPQKRFSGSGGTNPALSNVGRDQAERAATALASRGTIQHIIASPLTRTRETAAAVAARLGLDVTIEDGLRETDFGAWEGLTFGEVRDRYPEDLTTWLADPTAQPTGGGESFADTATRIAATRDKLTATYAGRTVLLVTHVTPIKTFVQLALGAPPESLFRMELSAASISAVAYYADGNASVRLFNDTSHLR